jgi:hypothetical protein
VTGSTATSPPSARTAPGALISPTWRPWCGIVYVAFVVDVYSRSIVGWSAALNKRTPLVLNALDMALWRRDRAGHTVDRGLIHHSGCRVAVHQLPVHHPPGRCRPRRLHRHGRRRTGQRAHGIGHRPYKTELIKPHGPWPSACSGPVSRISVCQRQSTRRPRPRRIPATWHEPPPRGRRGKEENRSHAGGLPHSTRWPAWCSAGPRGPSVGRRTAPAARRELP